MLLNLHAPTPLEYFASLVQSDDELPLLETAISLAQDEYPELDLQEPLLAVESLQSRLRRRCDRSASVLERIRLLNRFFYGELGFSVNRNDYYDPENSFLHAVLQSRRGIPISVGLLWLELARGIGLDAHGVSFPGHFMLKVLLAQGQVVLDPLTGKSFSSEELTEQLQSQIPRLSLVSDDVVPLAMFLQSARPREIIARMLRNLKEIYRTQHDAQRLLAVQQRLVVLLPQDWAELRDRGWAHLELEHTQQAMADFETYLDHARDASDTQQVAQKLRDLRTLS
ncbi:transglutaminase [Corticibacter populi]|uniref:Transglutaminase n=1 Tax=Corticibacter populi TaxID=1550736 RepID=A0A3M6QZU2_9BURK|nr:tetratricopeptide repeat protein [Corticibacter populi]RMX08475.1 transglutaminase [Corticibacter populi]RZS35788.1 regulator of sirC expression with transglutaminase-like and TPR domain [Corticibacter populi]